MPLGPLHSPIRFLQAEEVLSALESRLEGLAENPLYPEASTLLVRLFSSLIDTARLALQELQEKAALSFSQREKKVKDYDLARQRSKARQAPSAKELALREDLEAVDTKITTVSAHVDRIIEYFQELIARLRYIESSGVDHAPLSLARYLAEAATRPHPTHLVFVRRQWKPNFKYGEFISQLRAQAPIQLRSVFKEIGFNISMVSIPTVAQDNYLLSCLVAHEIGHLFNELNPFGGTSTTPSAVGGRKVEEVTGLAKTWEEELLADIYATLLLGPAYPLALMDFLLPKYGLDDYFLGERDPDYAYPSLRMRLSFILHTLRKQQIDVIAELVFLSGLWQDDPNEQRRTRLERRHQDSLEDDSKPVEEAFLSAVVRRLWALEALEEQSTVPLQDYSRAAHEVALAQGLWNAVNSRRQAAIDHAYLSLSMSDPSTDPVFTKAKLGRASLNSIAQKLKRRIPINETPADSHNGVLNSVPLDISLIINCGWFAYVRHQEECLSPDRSSDREAETLVKLIKRSVDAADFHRNFNSYRDLLLES